MEVIWLDDVVCEGEERRLADCRHAGWAEHNCAPSENVGVRCTCKMSSHYVTLHHIMSHYITLHHSQYAKMAVVNILALPPSSIMGFYILLTASHTNCSIRLSDSAHLDRPWAGSVEIFANDEWGRVCSDTWDLGDAHIACRQLGYYDALEVTSITSVPPSELYWLAG